MPYLIHGHYFVKQIVKYIKIQPHKTKLHNIQNSLLYFIAKSTMIKDVFF